MWLTILITDIVARWPHQQWTSTLTWLGTWYDIIKYDVILNEIITWVAYTCTCIHVQGLQVDWSSGTSTWNSAPIRIHGSI